MTPADKTVLPKSRPIGGNYWTMWLAVFENGHYEFRQHVNIMFIKNCIAYCNMNVTPYLFISVLNGL